MANAGERRALRRRGDGTSSRGQRPLAGLAATLLVLLLTGCPSLPPPERLEFDTDPRILRGSYFGSVDTREVPDWMALAGDASLLAASWHDSVELWDLDTSTLLTSVPIQTDEYTGLGGLSVDGSGSLVAGILRGNVLLWDGEDGTLVREFDPGDRLGACRYCGVYEIALAPAGNLLAAAGDAPLVLLVDTATGAVTRELETAGEEVGLVAFSADGALLASASYVSDTGYALRVWDTASYQVVFELEGTLSPSRRARFGFSADGRRLAVGSATKLELFDLAGGVTVLPLEESAGTWFLALSPDGTQAAFERPAERGADLAVVDVATRATLALFTDVLRGQPVWSADARYLIAGSKLVRANDFGVVRDHATGQLYSLELDATPQYVSSQTYAVSGTLSIDGGDGIEFSGIVDGNESQRYLQPQSRAPERATLEIELQGHPWRLQAQQNSRWDYPDPADFDDWWGHVTDGAEGEDQAWHPLRLWRGP